MLTERFERLRDMADIPPSVRADIIADVLRDYSCRRGPLRLATVASVAYQCEYDWPSVDGETVVAVVEVLWDQTDEEVPSPPVDFDHPELRAVYFSKLRAFMTGSGKAWGLRGKKFYLDPPVEEAGVSIYVLCRVLVTDASVPDQDARAVLKLAEALGREWMLGAQTEDRMGSLSTDLRFARDEVERLKGEYYAYFRGAGLTQ